MSEPMPPEGRMIVAAFMLLFFGGIGAGSLNTARQEWRWRDGEQVRGVLVKHGRWYHYEYAPKDGPRVIGATFYRSGSSAAIPDGIADDWVALQYDPRQPEKLRPYAMRGTARSGLGRFLITGSVGALFALVALVALWKFLHAWYDKRTAAD
jgi:hypothetical protein